MIKKKLITETYSGMNMKNKIKIINNKIKMKNKT